ncbi:MAG: 3-methylornithine--L-lysine ligase PylC [Deferrisomatales bacterium]
MKVAVVGGGLQGVEATYLARRAGWEVRVFDRRADAPAAGLADLFTVLDATDEAALLRAVRGADLLLPTLEDDEALAAIERAAGRAGLPLAFDPRAYAVSSSKQASDRLFARLGVPCPRPWPAADFPLIAKPSGGSGSRGVCVLRDAAAFEERFPGGIPTKGWVVQEYLEGPSYSLEVLGTPGRYRTLQVTELEMDRRYDCKRVRAPAALDPSGEEELRSLTATLAEALGLEGVMDVEVILHRQTLKVLEVDARLPSQTPTAVYGSTGVNLVELLGKLTLSGELPSEIDLRPRRAVIYEHLRAGPGTLEVTGEHAVARAGPLRWAPGFFGADEALTTYRPGASEWVATLLVTGRDGAEAWARRREVIRDLRRQLGLSRYRDAGPPEPEEGA